MAITKVSNGVGGRIRKVTITEINDNEVSHAKGIIKFYSFLDRNGTGPTLAALKRKVRMMKMRRL